MVRLTVFVAIGLAFTLATPVRAGAQAASPSLAITLNDTSFGPGQTISVAAKLTPGIVSAPVDAYIVVQLPTGQYLSLQLGGALAPGIVPIARGIVPVAYEAPLVSYRFNGIEPQGTYTWHAVLTRPGTLEFVAPLQQVAFTHRLSTPELTRTQLSEALRNGDFDTAGEFLASALTPLIRKVSPADRAMIAGALETCSTVDSTASYQVCTAAVFGNRFRFLLVRDERETWRVVVW